MSDAELAHAILDGVSDFLFELSNEEDDAPGIEEIRRRAMEHWRLLRVAMTPQQVIGTQEAIIDYMTKLSQERPR